MLYGANARRRSPRVCCILRAPQLMQTNRAFIFSSRSGIRLLFAVLGSLSIPQRTGYVGMFLECARWLICDDSGLFGDGNSTLPGVVCRNFDDTEYKAPLNVCKNAPSTVTLLARYARCSLKKCGTGRVSRIVKSRSSQSVSSFHTRSFVLANVSHLFLVPVILFYISYQFAIT